MARPIRLAQIFHEMAWPLLSELDFELINDPSKFDGPYCGTKAIYRSRNGFFLLVGFEPLDSRSAGMTCGRSWNYKTIIPEKPTTSRYSNRYYVLAKRLGFDLPTGYELRVDDEANSDIQSIVDDLNKTLPAVMKRVTEKDLIAIEQEKGGCQWFESQYGKQPSGLTFAGITPFRQN